MSGSLREQLSTIEAPEPLVDDRSDGTDIVSQGLVGDITVDGETASVPLALGAPYSPAETELAADVREAVESTGYRSELSVAIDDATPASEGPIVIAVSSGKGGVGKSTVAVNLAAGIADRGAAVGLFDADVYGPNIPRMLGVQGEPVRTDRNRQIVPVEAHGMKVMSIGFLVDEEMPVIWRGSMVDQTLTELWQNGNWGPLDYLIVDLPPGTGDAQLTILQQMPVTGSVVVTTPQDVALDNARKGVRLFDDHDAEVLGVVENMSAFVCSNCGEVHEVFRAGGGTRLAAEFDLPMLGRIPLDPAIGEAGEAGEPIALAETDVAALFADVAGDVLDRVGRRRRHSHTTRTDAIDA